MTDIELPIHTSSPASCSSRAQFLSKPPLASITALSTWCCLTHFTSWRRPDGVFANDASALARSATSTLSLATSMPTIVLLCAILRLPSLHVRARSPCNCSGLRKTLELSLAPSQAMP